MQNVNMLPIAKWISVVASCQFVHCSELRKCGVHSEFHYITKVKVHYKVPLVLVLGAILAGA